MDVISMSLGTNVAVRLEDDPEVQALSQAAAMGVIVVISAGNNGPDPATIGSPAVTPSAIAVGASNNDRFFAGSLLRAGGRTLAAMPAATLAMPAPVAAPLADVANLDGTGLGCNPLPAGSLTGAIALIFRGTCTFEIKLNNAQAAGAIAATIYDNVPGEDPITMSIGGATLPAGMISNADGLQLRTQLANAITGTLDLTPAPAFSDPARTLTITNIGTVADTFRLSVAARGGSAVAPQLSIDSVQLDPGASAAVAVQFAAGPLASGTYEGYINIQGSQSSVTNHVPYW